MSVLEYGPDVASFRSRNFFTFPRGFDGNTSDR